MTIDLAVVAKLLSAGIAALGLFLTHQKRPKLIGYMVHATGIPFGDSRVHTHTIVVRNDGSKLTTNVRLVHATLPHFAIYPPRPFTRDKYEGGEDIVIPSLVAKDGFTVTYLYGSDLTYRGVNTELKSDDGFAKIINVVPQRVIPKWQQVIASGLMIVGATVVIYPIVLWLLLALGIDPQ